MKTIVTGGLLFLIAFAAKAQVAAPGYEQRAQQETSFMTWKLSLSVAQADSVTVINHDYYSQVAASRSPATPAPQRQQQKQSAEIIWKSRLHNTLTDSQYNQYFTIIEANWQRVHHRIDSLNAAHRQH
ncbi:MAG TPA: hypothetical protein VGM41_17965 [Chitinophagaceae bacterium]|jgi:hypothetical protein